MIDPSGAQQLKGGRRQAQRPLAPHAISQGLRRLVVASSPPAARVTGESVRVTGHRPGVAVDVF